MTSTTYNKSASRQGSFVYEQVIAPARGAACGTMGGHKAKSFEEREYEFCFPEPNTGCWLWAGALDKDGYGLMRVTKNGTLRSHRVFYQHYIGPIADGLVIDHLCRVRCCVNPSHLEPVTSIENLLRGDTVLAFKRRQTECKNGHPLSGDNLIIRKSGRRGCRICMAKLNREGAARNRAKRRAEDPVAYRKQVTAWSKAAKKRKADGITPRPMRKYV